MLNFIHNIPTKIFFGKGQIEKLPEILIEYGKNVLLTYGGGSIKKNGLYDKVMLLLKKGGFKVVECSNIEPNPRIETVQRGVNLCKEHHIDVVLAVGGGSTIDCSKAICAGVYCENDLWEMIMTSNPSKKALPLVDILTLSATGSEFNVYGVISNLQTKQKIGAKLTFPSVSICDPTYTFTVSKMQTAVGSIDIMSHILEVYFSTLEDASITEGLCETILKTIIHDLPIALKNPTDYNARANLMYASTLACCGLPGYGKDLHEWSCHGIEHELSAFYDITHGIGLAILTPRWMEHILSNQTINRFVRFGKNVWGLSDDNPSMLAKKSIQKLYDFFASCEVPMSLHELGIDEQYFEQMAEDAVTYGRLKHAYVPLSKEDVITILKKCL